MEQGSIFLEYLFRSNNIESALLELKKGDKLAILEGYRA